MGVEGAQKKTASGKSVAASAWMRGRAAAAMTLRSTVTRVRLLVKPPRSSVAGPQVIRASINDHKKTENNNKKKDKKQAKRIQIKSEEQK